MLVCECTSEAESERESLWVKVADEERKL